jgi:sugar O-acyltransferase (sialic acid O-acetyltransferase NeuD family)
MESTLNRQKVVVFGLADFSSLAWYVLTHDSHFEVVAFTADQDYLDKPFHHGLPVVPFESIAQYYPPDEVSLLIPLSMRELNRLRAERYASAKAAGYKLVSWVSSRALTWPDLQLGDNCMVYEGVIVQPFARIGNNCILRSGCNISHHAVIDDHVFIASGAVVAGGARVGERCFLGLGSVVRDGVTVAPRCLIGAGAVVTANTEPDSLYMGVPAKRQPLPANL